MANIVLADGCMDILWRHVGGESATRLAEGRRFDRLVLATQNPIEYEGTFPLPEADASPQSAF